MAVTAEQARTALLDLFRILDEEDWDAFAAAMDDDVQLADELTGTWLRGRPAVTRYLRAQAGVVTNVVSEPLEVKAQLITDGLWLLTFDFRQHYLLDGSEWRQRMTGCCLLRISGAIWRLVLFHLGGEQNANLAESQSGATSATTPASELTGDDAVTLGIRIKEARTTSGMSLRQLALRSNLSASFLSQIERGSSEPTVGSLRRIAAGLSMPLTGLLLTNSDPNPDSAIAVTSGARRQSIRLNEYGIAVDVFAKPSASLLDAHIRHFGPTATEPGPDVHHESNAFAYVLKGRILLGYGDKARTLSEGDAVITAEGGALQARPAPGREATVLYVTCVTSAAVTQADTEVQRLQESQSNLPSQNEVRSSK